MLHDICCKIWPCIVSKSIIQTTLCSAGTYCWTKLASKAIIIVSERNILILLFPFIVSVQLPGYTTWQWIVKSIWNNTDRVASGPQEYKPESRFPFFNLALKCVLTYPSLQAFFFMHSPPHSIICRLPGCQKRRERRLNWQRLKPRYFHRVIQQQSNSHIQFCIHSKL